MITLDLDAPPSKGDSAVKSLFHECDESSDLDLISVAIFSALSINFYNIARLPACDVSFCVKDLKHGLL